MIRARPFIALTILLVSATFTAPVYAGIPLQDETGTVTEDQIQKITEAYGTIPEYIRNLYEANGNRIVIKDGSSDTNWLGQYDGKDGRNATIYITNIGYGGAESVVHEIGHFIDDVLKADSGQAGNTYLYKGFRFSSGYGQTERYLSVLSEFTTIYSQEQNTAPVTNYEKVTPTEYFAGSFRVYCVDREALKNEAPMTYQYIDKKIQELITVK